MKTKLLTFGIFVALGLHASATIVNLSGGPFGLTFLQSSSGTPLPDGMPVEVGRMENGFFIPLGTGGLIATAFGSPGKWAGTAADNSFGADVFNGAQIWGRITDYEGAVVVFTASDQSEWFFQNNTHGVGDSSYPNSIDIDRIDAALSSPGYVLTSDSLSFGFLTSLGTPEPSISLLAGLSGLGLLIRRKR
jgi:hypothetical protein